MSKSDIGKIDQIDLTRLTVQDIVSLKNKVMRRALLEIIIGIARPAEHADHMNHSNHYKTITTGEILEEPVAESN